MIIAMNTLIFIAVAAVAALAAWAVTRTILSNRNTEALHSKDLLIQQKDAALASAEALRTQAEATARERIEEVRAEGARALEAAKETYQKTLSELKEGQQKVIDAARNELTIASEKQLKERQEAMKKEAEEMCKGITGELGKDLRAMKESFDSQKEASIKEAESIRTKFDETVRSLGETTRDIGLKADNLAQAMKGKVKMHGGWGESILENILKQEGFVLGRDYEKEYVIRDASGAGVRNEDSDKGMRPDFIVHFPNGSDVAIDSKVSLTALSDYCAAKTDEERAEASRRNLESVKRHIATLASKDYQKYLAGRDSIGYTIMFIPNYGAFQLAKQEDPRLYYDALDRKVIVTTEETVLVLLRFIHLFWQQKIQLENAHNICVHASNVIKRVGLFCEENAKLGRQLATAMGTYTANTNRLVDGRQSIVGAAYDIKECGIDEDVNHPLPELNINTKESV